MAAATVMICLFLSGCGDRSAHRPVSASYLDTVDIDSQALGKMKHAAVYVPPGYDPKREYPVLYALYGYGGTRDSVFSLMGLNRVADRLIAEGKIKPLLIVSPDYGQSFGVNTTPGQGVKPPGVDEGRYEDYLIKELIPQIDRTYSTHSQRSGRMLAGFSMGGFASLYLGFRHADLFSRVGGHSAAIWDYGAEDDYIDQRDWLYPSEPLRNERDPFRLAVSRDLSGIAVYLDAGAEDGLAGVDEKLYRLLRQTGVAAEWHTWPGGHAVSYWTGHFADYLQFYAGQS